MKLRLRRERKSHDVALGGQHLFLDDVSGILTPHSY